MAASETLRDRAVGALLGCAVGDAIGELAFTHASKDRLQAAVARAQHLVYTDDTAMAIAVANALVEDGLIHAQALGDRFARGFQLEPWRGYGPGPPAIFKTVAETGRAYEEVARELYGGEGSLGNGAAMRAAPLGVAYRDTERLPAACDTASAVTHAHPVGRDAALLVARAVGQAIEAAIEGRRIRPHALAQHLTDGCRSEEMRHKMQAVTDYLEAGAQAEAVADAVGRSVSAPESVPFAVYAFLATPDDFEACLDTAALHGGDRDTLAAMAGSIAGAYLGEPAIPAPWRSRIEHRCQLRELARRLADAFPDSARAAAAQ
ncbi:ADP-ribosylglycohydrolase family protein [Rhodovibrio sodomensis]|uniref:ADP-ribosylglycohydrolase family protein n=1 Tax=Rhodovibrio sodomensis TaxID=1088 RepID=UPI001907BA53|nr:ADP-ribosylglycohydrolase family protein [Rhodovibrio sodomensis]